VGKATLKSNTIEALNDNLFQKSNTDKASNDFFNSNANEV
jgi:hypothetical protein